VPRAARACAAAEEWVLPRAVLRWLACHQPGQVARIKAALPHEALPHVWHVRARLSSGASYHVVVFIPAGGAGIRTRAHRLERHDGAHSLTGADQFRSVRGRLQVRFRPPSDPRQRPLQSIR
jgi:hypothetical protein